MMRLWKSALALWLVSTSLAQQQIPTHAPPSPLPAAAPVRLEKVNWQAPPDPSATATPKARKSNKKGGGGKTKWIVIAAVAGGAAVSVALLNKRLGNEGKGIF